MWPIFILVGIGAFVQLVSRDKPATTTFKQ
jgi:hypothetical protein